MKPRKNKKKIAFKNELDAVSRRISLWKLALEEGRIIEVHKEIDSISKRVKALVDKAG